MVWFAFFFFPPSLSRQLETRGLLSSFSIKEDLTCILCSLLGCCVISSMLVRSLLILPSGKGSVAVTGWFLGQDCGGCWLTKVRERAQTRTASCQLQVKSSACEHGCALVWMVFQSPHVALKSCAWVLQKLVVWKRSIS